MSDGSTSFAALREGERFSAAGRISVIENGTGLSWGTDAWLLASYARPSRRICELGCGRGVISLLLAGYGKSEDVVGAELNPASSDAAARAAVINGLDSSLRILCRDIRTMKYTDPDVGGRFSAVVANPPYIAHPGLKNSDPEADDARHENNGGIADFCAAAARLLNHRGSFFCVFRPARLPDLFAAMRQSGIEPKRMTAVFPDTVSPPSLILCEGILGGAPGLETAPPFIIYDAPADGSPRRMTARAQSVYEKCSFQI